VDEAAAERLSARVWREQGVAATKAVVTRRPIRYVALCRWASKPSSLSEPLCTWRAPWVSQLSQAVQGPKASTVREGIWRRRAGSSRTSRCSAIGDSPDCLPS
jgi:hypothetical protein